MIYDGTNSYLYDAENRICAVQNSSNALTGYVYDAAGIRVAKGSLTQFTCDFNPADSATTYNGFAANTSWALDSNSQQVGEWKLVGSTWTWQHSNIYAGKLLGTYDTLGLHFYFDDWLGTRRVQTNSVGQLEQTCQSLPYGNGQNCATTALATADDPTEQHFTGKERDQESGNDYFDARYYSSLAGRFLSPDWSAKAEPIPYAKLDDPQSLNLYGYVRSNPITRLDADGHDITYQKPAKPPTNKKELELLKRIDSAYGGKKHIIVTSGYRDPATNTAAGGAKDSYHMKGMAADFHVPGQTPDQVAAQAVKSGATGVSTYDGLTGGNPRVHADVRPGEWNGLDGKTLKTTPQWRSNPDKVLGTVSSENSSSGGLRNAIQSVVNFLIAHF